MKAANRPAHEFRLGAIRATIWLNQSETSKPWYRVAFAKHYLDGDAWKETTSFGRDDLPLVSKAADLAYAWIWKNTEERGDDR